MGELMSYQISIDLDDEIKKLNDTFWKPCLAIETIEQMHKKQENLIYDITTRLKQINEA